jgi:subtilisin family serine protease
MRPPTNDRSRYEMLVRGILLMAMAMAVLASDASELPASTMSQSNPKETQNGKALIGSDEAKVPPYSAPVKTLEEALKSGRIKAETVEVLHRKGMAPIILKLRTKAPFRSEGQLTKAQVEQQRSEILQVQSLVLKKLDQGLQGSGIAHVKQYYSVPYLAIQANKAALDVLVAMEEVLRILPDRLNDATLNFSIPHIGADKVHRAADTPEDDAFEVGRGQAIAILDTGVDSSHSFFGGRVVAEACFAEDCPGGGNAAVGSGTAMPCSYNGCDHGTHVAGIAAGGGPFFRGVATGANIIAVRVFHREDCDRRIGRPPPCGMPDNRPTEEVPCPLASDSDVIAGLEHVYSLRNSFSIAAVNLSLGGGVFTNASDCDEDLSCFRDIVRNLRDAGIATIAAAGNEGEICDGSSLKFQPGLGGPACISEVVSVGNTDTGDMVHRSSMTAPFLDLLAPGTGVDSAVPGGGFDRKTGTSMAAPHVAGSWAVLKALTSTQSVDDILNELRTTGVMVTDMRPTTLNPPQPAVTKPRIQVDAAYESGSKAPLPPSGLTLGGVSGTGIFLEWTDNSRSETAFEATAIPQNAGPFVGSRSTTVGQNTTDTRIERLTPNTSYELAVRACNAVARCSLNSRPVTRTTQNTLPTRPQNFRIGMVTTTSIQVLWDGRSLNPVSNFLLRSDANRSGQWLTRSLPPTPWEAMYTNLSPNSAYNFILTACNNDGCSADTPILHVATLTAGSPPSAPSNMRVCASQSGVPVPQACFSGGVTLLWNDTSNNEDYFEFEWSRSPPGALPPPGAESWIKLQVAANRQSHFLTSPMAGEYKFRIRACNVGGCSAYSNTASYSVP